MVAANRIARPGVKRSIRRQLLYAHSQIGGDVGRFVQQTFIDLIVLHHPLHIFAGFRERLEGVGAFLDEKASLYFLVQSII